MDPDFDRNKILTQNPEKDHQSEIIEKAVFLSEIG
jgi:hypothetical protein